MKTIAVYGSLKMGRYNHPLLDDSVFLGESDVVGTMYLISVYPALVDEGKTVHTVELYDVEDDIFLRINNMEVGAGYKGVLKDFKLGNDTVKAIVYYADTDLAEYCKANRKVIDSY